MAKKLEVKNVPNLRFKGFEDEWKTVKLGNIGTFSKGKGISKSDIELDGVTECIRYGELYTHYGEVINDIKSKTNVNVSLLVLSQANDVIIPASGESTIDIATASCVLKSGIALGGDLNIIKTDNNGVFLSYYLNSKKKLEIANLAQGVSVVHLYSSQLASLNLNLPTYEEQNRISVFLIKLDLRIAAQIKIIEELELLKSTVSKKIFTQKLKLIDKSGNSYPEWQTRSLGEIGQTYNGLTGKTKEDFGVGRPYIQYKQIFDRSKIDTTKCELVSINKNENQYRVKKGDVFFTVSSETPEEIGMSSILLDEVDELYLNSFCFGYRVNSNETLLPNFARYLFRSDVVRNEIIKLAQGSTRYNMSKVALMRLNVNLPGKEEQFQIGGFLTTLDDKIDLEEKLLNKFKTQKQYLLSNLFI